MTNKTEAPNDLDRAFAELMALTPSEIVERVKQYADHPFAKTLRELNQVDDAADELSRLQDENERQRCSIEALVARRNAMSDRIAQLEAERDEARTQLAQRQAPADSLTVNFVRHAWLDKHKARECEQIVTQWLAASPTPPQRAPEYVAINGLQALAPRGNTTAIDCCGGYCGGKKCS